MHVDCIFQPTKLESLSSPSETKINFFKTIFSYGEYLSYGALKKQVNIFPNTFFIMYLGSIFQPTKFESLLKPRVCSVACQTDPCQTLIIHTSTLDFSLVI